MSPDQVALVDVLIFWTLQMVVLFFPVRWLARRKGRRTWPYLVLTLLGLIVLMLRGPSYRSASYRQFAGSRGASSGYKRRIR